jgi:beta-lactamase class C
MLAMCQACQQEGKFSRQLSINSSFAMSLFSSGAKPRIVENKLDKHTETFVNSFRHKFDSLGCPGASMVILKDSTFLETFSFGVGDKNVKNKINENSIFRIGSVSKSFAGLLTGILVDKGILHWDDKIVKYLPDFKLATEAQTQKITIRTILSQSTGLASHAYTNMVEEGYEKGQIMKYLCKVKIVADTGRVCTYQNAVYSLIELVMEQATGCSYHQLLNQYVISPLSMKNTSTSFGKLTSTSSFTRPHNMSKGVAIPIPYNNKYYNAVSAGGVNSTAIDMGKYLSIWLGYYPEVISPDQVSFLTTPVVSSDYERRNFDRWPLLEKAYYAIGWRVLDYDGDRWLYHGGFVNGYRCEIAFNPGRKVGICVMFNAVCPLASEVIPNFIDATNLSLN